jgi:hypothetical protein
MGNRAIITCGKAKTSPAIYLHWNGGPESVLAFLHAAKKMDVRSPESDPAYFLGRMAQIIGNFFGGSTSVGIGQAGHMDDSDNGIYVVGGDFEIKSRQYGGPKTVEDLSSRELEKYEGMRDGIIKNQGPAFDESDWRTDVVITRVKSEVQK